MRYDRYKEIDILRGIAFMLVLIGHSFPDSAYGYINRYTEFAHEFIYSFHMPLFFIISGFCMKPLLYRKEADMKKEIIKRSKRLLIPYLFYSYIAIIPKVVFSAFMYLPFNRSQLWEILLGKSPSGTLWYIWTLYVINILFLTVSRIFPDKNVWLSISSLMYIVYLYIPDCYFSSLLQYPLFFSAGVFVAVFAEKIFGVLRMRGGIWIPVLLSVNAYLVYVKDSAPIAGLLMALSGSTAMLCAAVKLTAQDGRLCSLLKLAGEYSYGIYLMSPYVMVGIRVFCYKALGFPYWFCMAAMVICGFGVPYLFIRYAVRRNRWLCGLLIGKWT